MTRIDFEAWIEGDESTKRETGAHGHQARALTTVATVAVPTERKPLKWPVITDTSTARNDERWKGHRKTRVGIWERNEWLVAVETTAPTRLCRSRHKPLRTLRSYGNGHERYRLQTPWNGVIAG